MDPTLIHSGLATRCMLDAICSWDDKTIVAERTFRQEPGFAAIEACAQLCALHVRRCGDFGCHAFLLSISSVTPLPPNRVQGPGRFEAKSSGASRHAFSYAVEISITPDPPIQVALTIGTTDYGEAFREDKLRRHYRRLFACLSRPKI